MSGSDQDPYKYDAGPSPLRDWLLARLRGPRVLDVGCGTGYMGRCRPDLLWTGIERHPKAAQVASSHYEHVVCGPAEAEYTQSSLRGVFDDILFCDSLEHFVDSAAVLESYASFLTRRGRVLVAIPNIAHISVRLALLLGNWDYTDSGPLDDTHLRFFTYDTGQLLLNQAGLSIIEVGSRLALPRGLRWTTPLARMRPTVFSTHLLAVAVREPMSRS